MSADLTILLDGLILVFLCVTIFYAARLSMFMKTFREGREGMQVLIRDLTKTIKKAESSIAYTKDQIGIAEKDLRDIINEAKFMTDELKFMTESGNDLAVRLEKLAGRNRELVDLVERAGGIGTQNIVPPSIPKSATKTPQKPVKKPFAQTEEAFDDLVSEEEEALDYDDEYDFLKLENGAYERDEVQVKEEIKSKVDTNAKSKVRSFAIFDRELDEIEKAKMKDVIEEVAEEEFDDSDFLSRAEQDLYEALQRRKKVKTSS